MNRNSRLNSLSATKDKRLLFKVVKTNWTHNNRPFLDVATIYFITKGAVCNMMAGVSLMVLVVNGTST